ncbi:28858_t:CDS:2, partial [Gigaspora margarita]
MDDNFVKFVPTNEPSYGIEENKWIFKTSSQTVREQYSGVVRLIQDGTRLYDSLSPSDKPEFLNNLQQEFIANPYQDPVSQIVKTMTEIIKDENTIIYMNIYTKYLDSSYGLTIY